MITLVLEENRLLKDNEVITDVTSFCRELSTKVEVTLLLKSHDISYHFCPIKKAARFIKSAEFSPQHWIGEKIISRKSLMKPFSPTQLLIAGIMPTLFMHQMIQQVANEDWCLKGIYLWSDCIMQMYQPIPMGWVMIIHEDHLFVCYNKIMKFTRSCEVPFTEELPRILRYIKRFGFETNSPVIVLSNDYISGDLPSYITSEIRKISPWQPQGVTVHMPAFVKHQRYYAWPKKVNMAAWSATVLLIISTLFTTVDVVSNFRHEQKLKRQIHSISHANVLTPDKFNAFMQYCHLIKGRQDPRLLIGRLSPYLKDEAVVTYLDWTPDRLILQLEFNPATSIDQFWLNIRSQLLDYQISWQEDENEPLKGVLTLEKNSIHKATL